MRILLVCLGNICRSPTAEAAMREAVAASGLEQSIEVDSAGTGTWHLGEPPDPRMVAAAAEAGLDVSGRARQVTVDDFAEFDLILVMDRSNLEDVRRLAPDGRARERVRLFRSFEDGAGSFEDGAGGDEVPDPYYGEAGGFERVVEITRRSAQGLVAWIQAEGRERVRDRVG